MSKYDGPAGWLDSAIGYLREANKDIENASGSFIDAIRRGALGYDENDYCTVAREAMRNCFEEIINAAEAIADIMRNIPKEEEKDGEV